MPKTIALTPKVHGVGGMVSFRHKLTAGLEARGYQVTMDLRTPQIDAVLVIGGTRDLNGLRQAKLRGIPIVQRLNGMNWLHRKQWTGLRHFIRAEYGNFILKTIRAKFADKIVYQSQFSQDWWERIYGPTQVHSTIIHNGVDLTTYTPAGPFTRPSTNYRILLVEGNIGGGYEMGLESAVAFSEILAQDFDLSIGLTVVGKVSNEIMASWNKRSGVQIEWVGLVDRAAIPQIDRSAHLLYSSDINAACPNSVIEALACGLPVVAFDTGALGELVPPATGQVVPYGGDPWQLDSPDVRALAKGAAEILQDQDAFRHAARAHAEQHFGLDLMVDRYLKELISG